MAGARICLNSASRCFQKTRHVLRSGSALRWRPSSAQVSGSTSVPSALPIPLPVAPRNARKRSKQSVSRFAFVHVGRDEHLLPERA